MLPLQPLLSLFPAAVLLEQVVTLRQQALQLEFSEQRQPKLESEQEQQKIGTGYRERAQSALRLGLSMLSSGVQQVLRQQARMPLGEGQVADFQGTRACAVCVCAWTWNEN